MARTLDSKTLTALTGTASAELLGATSEGAPYAAAYLDDNGVWQLVVDDPASRAKAGNRPILVVFVER